MRVLITGHAGFLGRHFTRHYIEQGHAVTGIDNRPSPDASRLKTSLVADAADWFRGSDQHFDLVIHMAGIVGGRLVIEGDPLANADGLRLDSAMYRWATKHAGVVVFPSSSAVYGVAFQRGLGQALHESLFDPAADHWPAPDEMYGFTKMAGEVLAAKAAQYGLSTLLLRPFSGYGEGQSLDYPVPAICMRAQRREHPLTIWGSGNQSRDFIHVSDLVGATQAFLDRGFVGALPVNLGSGVATTFRQVAELAADIVGYSPDITSDESKPVGVNARFSDPSRMLDVYQPQVGLRDGLTRVLDSLSQKE